jgi:UDP-glucuronate decarboxylase
VVSNFIVSALRGDPLTIYGDGSQTRSFCFVDDLVSGLVDMMATGDEVIGPINLGNPGEFTMSELAAEVIAAVGTDPGTVWLPLPTDDPTRRQPDISRARTTLGWEPKVALKEGLATTVAHFRGLLASN